MKYISFLFLILLITISFSCKKKTDKLLVSGNLCDPNKSAAISDVKVNLSGKIIDGGTWNSSYTTLAEANTSQSGDFNIETDNVRVSDFKLSLTKPDYIASEIIIGSEEILPNEDYHNNYILYSESFLQVFVKNQNPVNSYDQMKYRILNGLAVCNNCCTSDYLTFSGDNVNDTILCIVPGNQNITIEWQVIKNSTPNTYSQTVFIEEFSTVDFSISY